MSPQKDEQEAPISLRLWDRTEEIVQKAMPLFPAYSKNAVINIVLLHWECEHKEVLLIAAKEGRTKGKAE